MWKWIPVCCWLGAAGAVGQAPKAAHQVLVEDVVAVVNRHVITRSEVWQEAVMVLVERRGASGLELAITPVFLERVLEMLINQRVLLDEARRLGLPLETRQERQALLEGFRRSFGDPDLYARFLLKYDLDEEAVAEILARHLRVDRLKERKLRMMPEIGEDEIKRYYQKHRHQLGGAPLDQVAEAIRLKLVTARRDKRLARWVWELRKRSQVKVLVELGPADEEGS